MVIRLEDLCVIQVAVFQAKEFFYEIEIDDLIFVHEPRWHAKKYVKSQNRWYKLFDKRISNSLLMFPVGLRRKIPKPLIMLLIKDIIKWVNFHSQKFDLNVEFCLRFLKLDSFFTSKGINREEAARELINNTELSIHVRFCLACHYCFDEYVLDLWRQIPVNEKPRFIKGKFHCDLNIYQRSKLVNLWCGRLLGQKQKGDNFSMMKFETVVDFGDGVSVKNCWKNLSEEEIRRALGYFAFFSLEIDYGIQFFSINILEHIDFLDVLKFLIFDVNNVGLFMCCNIYELLFHFLNWPYQEYFMKSIPHVWSYIFKIEFYMLLHRIVFLMQHQFSCKLYDYRSIFIEFWNHSPISFKKSVVNHESKSSYSIFISDDICYDFADAHSDYGKLELKKVLLISELFNHESYSEEDLCIIQLILESATEEEKSGIVKLQGDSICVKAISVGDLRTPDLFIECCVPNEDTSSFKRTLVRRHEVRVALWKFILKGNFSCVEKILNWALNSEEIKEFKEDLMLLLLPHEVHLYTSDEIKCIDGYLECIFTPNKIKDYKRNLASNLKGLVESFKPFILKGDFKKINYFLQWSFSLESEIKHYKKDLASEAICNSYCFDASKDLGQINKLVKWCGLSPEERKGLKKQFAFKKCVIKAYNGILIELKFNCIDTFIRWSELTQEDVKHYKEILVLFSTDLHPVINEVLVMGKLELVDRFFSWTQFSKMGIEAFKEQMRENLNLNKYLFDLKSKFEDIERLFMYLQLPEERKKIIKKNFALKSYDLIIKYIKESKWDEVDEFVNWCFPSREDLNWFRYGVLRGIGSRLCPEFLLCQRFNDVDIFLNWMEINEKEKEEFLKEILYDDDFLLRIGKVLGNGLEEFERILDKISDYNLLTVKWKESFIAWSSKIVNIGLCFYCKDSSRGRTCEFCDKLKPTLKDAMKYDRIINEHMKREKKVTDLKRKVKEISVESQLRKGKMRKC